MKFSPFVGREVMMKNINHVHIKSYNVKKNIQKAWDTDILNGLHLRPPGGV